ncbi:MAG: DegT/DnrJ/EryC1/StrS family aminotransferase [Bacteroidetes bacterium]|nr:MAG: DegT/DnrJ/EryC1/StrS family aminotransferase [Bacteroidota bacterium]
MSTPIYVTQPYMPPLKEFLPYLQEIWDSHILTNGGPFHQELEQKLCEYLGVEYISLFSNGTLALITALQALRITGEVITTPYSFVATTHALWWNNIKPVFVDVEPNTFNIDPEQIESAITPQTSAILPVHVYGNPCNTKRIHEIAEKYGLKIIYDAAHAFGVRIAGTSVASFGDLSVLSFHATKVFNTFEGGAIICHDENTKKLIDQLKNFGIVDETTVVTPGINAKMNEFQSALGLLQIKYLNGVINKRKKITEIYRMALRNIPGITFLSDQPEVNHNYAYFPIFINSKEFGKTRDAIYEEFKVNNIFCRRYFYPLISQLPIYCNLESSQLGKMPIAERITKEVLCLPIYPYLEISTVNFICGIINNHWR